MGQGTGLSIRNAIRSKWMGAHIRQFILDAVTPDLDKGIVMGGGLGGSQTQTTSVPAWLEALGQQVAGRGQQAANVGYVPYSGPEVAAFTPMQNAAFEGTNQAASAFGMPTSQGNGMPPPQTFANGVQGYSSMPLYDQAIQQLRQTRPGQYNAIANMFVDPFTRRAQAAPQGHTHGQPAPQPTGPTGGQNHSPSWNNHPNNPNNQGNGQLRPEIRPTAGGNPFAGYTGLRDMVNGGGPGANGGGLLSRIFGGRG